MRKILLLNWLMLSIPFNALAHPGHAAFAGPGGGQLLGAAAVAAAALLVGASWLYRRRPATRADG